MNSISKSSLLIVALLGLIGCGTVDKAIKHGSLDVQTKMSETVFLDPVPDNKRTVVLQIRNTSDKKDLQIESEIRQVLESKGYRIISDPDKAYFMIQANILQVGKSTLEDPFSSLTGGYSGALGGMATGAYASAAFGGDAMMGGLIGGIGGTIGDAMVQVVQYTMITDLQISEKASGKVVNEASNAQLKQGTSGNKSSSWNEKTNWKKYQTRIISLAKKTNLKFEIALPELKQGLIQSIAGIL